MVSCYRKYVITCASVAAGHRCGCSRSQLGVLRCKPLTTRRRAPSLTARRLALPLTMLSPPGA
eukprot:5744716-Pleurochrysis_carterae.AAC.1